MDTDAGRFQGDESDTARQHRRRIAFIPFALALLAFLVGAFSMIVRHWWPNAANLMVGSSGALLIFDVPVCIWVIVDWIRTGEPPELNLSPLIPCREERDLHRRLRERPKLGDEAFCRIYFSDVDVPRDVPIRLRELIEDIMGIDMRGVHPNDNLLWLDSELDFVYVLERIETEFGVRIPTDQVRFDDCQFGALVNRIAAALRPRT